MRATLTLLICLAAPLLAEAQEWRSVLVRDGVQVFSRPVEGSPIWELRAAATFPVPPQRLLAALADTAAYPQNLPPTESVRLLRREGDVSWVYMVLNPPFIARRDSCIRTMISRLADGRLISAWQAAVDGCPPPQRGLVRIERNHGRWLLTPAQGGQATEVDYELYTDPGGQVPAWLVNRGTARSLPELFRTLRAAVTGPRYQ